MRGVQGTHKLSRDAARRGHGNEVQKAVQAENKEDHTCQVSCDCGNGSHRSSPLVDDHKVISALLAFVRFFTRGDKWKTLLL